MKLFDQLLIHYSSLPGRFEVCHGIAFGHRMLIMPTKKDEDKRIIELSDNKVIVEHNHSNFSFESFDETVRVFGGLY